MTEILRFVDEEGILVVAATRETGGLDILMVGASIPNGVHSSEVYLSRESILRLSDAIEPKEEKTEPKWAKISFEEVCVGDLVRLLEPSGCTRPASEVVGVRDGIGEFRTMSDGWLVGIDADNGWGVERREG